MKCKELFQKIDEIMNDFKIIILSCDDKVASNEEVRNICDMYIDLGFLLDGVFSLVRTECGKLTEEITQLTRRMIKAAVKLWKYLRLSMLAPKMHGMEDHLLQQMIKWGD